MKIFKIDVTLLLQKRLNGRRICKKVLGENRKKNIFKKKSFFALFLILKGTIFAIAFEK